MFCVFFCSEIFVSSRPRTGSAVACLYSPGHMQYVSRTMHVDIVISVVMTFSRLGIDRLRLPILLEVSQTEKMIFSPVPVRA